MAGCMLRIQEMMSSLTNKEQQIASYILDYSGDVVRMSIDELASACNVSVSSVVRLCKTLGYSGYKELCRVLSMDLALNQQDNITYTDVRPGDSIQNIIRSVSMNSVKAIENTMAVLDETELEKAVEAISRARRVDFYGVGTSGTVALDAHNKFLRINKISLASADPHLQVLAATTLSPEDVVVLISYTGETKDILETADVIIQTGATIISITRYGRNPLSDRANIRLCSSASETLIRSATMGSRIGQLSIIDMLYTAVVSRDYDIARTHIDKTRLITARKRIRSGNN
ncbi:MAG: MurR/RpiR family transcriptional regulator [Bacillota bacterium]|nr:MurR/RpiR family transcriptional regulator [Bacillota bacterium]